MKNKNPHRKKDKAGSLAGKVLSDPKAPKDAKSLAGYVLVQRKKR